jgi:hypothetical protein
MKRVERDRSATDLVDCRLEDLALADELAADIAASPKSEQAGTNLNPLFHTFKPTAGCRLGSFADMTSALRRFRFMP